MSFYEVALDGNCICFPLEYIKNDNSRWVLQGCNRCCWGPVPIVGLQSCLHAGSLQDLLSTLAPKAPVRLSPLGPHRHPAPRCASIMLAASFLASPPHPQWCLLGSLEFPALRGLVFSWGSQIKSLEACEFQVIGTTDWKLGRDVD